MGTVPRWEGMARVLLELFLLFMETVPRWEGTVLVLLFFFLLFMETVPRWEGNKNSSSSSSSWVG